MIIAHAGTGTGFDHPKNSRGALITALQIGCDGIELDVQLTADSVLVIYHDQYLESITPCTGLVNARTWYELKSCPPVINERSFHIERVDSLLLDAADKFPGAEFMLDCKLFAHGEWWPYLETYTNALAELQDLPSLRDRVMVECMVDDFLLLMQRKNAQVPLFLYGSDAEHIIWRATTSHYKGITVDRRNISAEQVAKAKDLGLEVTLLGAGGWWSHRSALAKKPTRIQTDSPEDLVP